VFKTFSHAFQTVKDWKKRDYILERISTSSTHTLSWSVHLYFFNLEIFCWELLIHPHTVQWLRWNFKQEVQVQDEISDHAARAAIPVTIFWQQAEV